jgi:hypothetical protein
MPINADGLFINPERLQEHILSVRSVAPGLTPRIASGSPTSRFAKVGTE